MNCCRVKYEKTLKRQKFWLKILLTEKEELEDLVEQYEANMSNATSLRVRIMEIVNTEKYNNDNFKEKILQRISRLRTSLSLSSRKSETQQNCKIDELNKQ